MINNGKLRGRNFKRKVLDLLKAEDFSEALELLCELPPRRTINPLFLSFCNPDHKIRWRAITATGAVVANLAEKDMESARIVMRRIIWNLNDESGGIGWGMPEAMGEIMARHDGLAREYANILMSYAQEDGNFLELESLQGGVLWGLGRLAQARPHLLHDVVPHLHEHLSSKNHTLRGLAVWVIGLLTPENVRSSLNGLVEDEGELSLYVDGSQRTCRVSDLAKEALVKVDAAIPAE
jgi:hypothetical protein